MTRVDLPAAHGHLEAIWQPEPDAQGLALVCHPHPLFGGTMQNTATFRLAKAWNTAGCSALRFNFRGVGGSTGQPGNGDGVPELEDARAALAWLRQQRPALPIFTSGISFGSRTALQLATLEPGIEGVLALGFPASLFPGDFLHALKIRAAFVHADRDEYAAPSEVRKLLTTIPAPTALFELPDSDHFATGRLDALSERLAQAIDFLRS
jgi:uncharacterized protein